MSTTSAEARNSTDAQLGSVVVQTMISCGTKSDPWNGELPGTCAHFIIDRDGTIYQLAKLDVPFVTSLGVGAHLEAWGVRPERIVELDWWESHTLPSTELSITAAPSQHPRR